MTRLLLCLSVILLTSPAFAVDEDTLNDRWRHFKGHLATEATSIMRYGSMLI